MSRWSTARAWVAVHSTRAALSITSIVAVASFIFGSSSVSNFGLVWLPIPVSALLLLPAIAGSAVAIACDNTARLTLPDPPRAVLGRTIWLTVWILIAIGAANIGQSFGSPVNAAAVTRNVLLHAAIGLLVLRVGATHLVWLPPLFYTIVCMMFGFPSHEPRYYWWAVIMQDEITRPQWLTIGAIFLAASALYIATAQKPTLVHRPRFGNRQGKEKSCTSLESTRSDG